MATPVSICSDALLMLGASPIADFNEPGDRARLCANLYPANRAAILRSHTWNCCVKRVLLDPVDEPLPLGYRRRFKLPSDWLRTLKVGERGWSSDYRHEGRYICSDAGSVELRYVADVDEGSWDALLVQVMVQRMAAVLAYPVTKSTSLRDSMTAELTMLLRQAKSIDSMGEPGEMIAEESPLLVVRG